MVFTESLSRAILAENCATVAGVGHVKHIMVDFSSHDRNHRRTPTVVRIQHGHLTVNFGKNLID